MAVITSGCVPFSGDAGGHQPDGEGGDLTSKSRQPRIQKSTVYEWPVPVTISGAMYSIVPMNELNLPMGGNTAAVRDFRSALYNWPAKIERWPSDLHGSNLYLKRRPYSVLRFVYQ